MGVRAWSMRTCGCGNVKTGIHVQEEQDVV